MTVLKLWILNLLILIYKTIKVKYKKTIKLCICKVKLELSFIWLYLYPKREHNCKVLPAPSYLGRESRRTKTLQPLFFTPQNNLLHSHTLLRIASYLYTFFTESAMENRNDRTFLEWTSYGDDFLSSFL